MLCLASFSSNIFHTLEFLKCTCSLYPEPCMNPTFILHSTELISFAFRTCIGFVYNKFNLQELWNIQDDCYQQRRENEDQEVDARWGWEFRGPELKGLEDCHQPLSRDAHHQEGLQRHQNGSEVWQIKEWEILLSEKKYTAWDARNRGRTGWWILPYRNSFQPAPQSERGHRTHRGHTDFDER